MKAPRNLRCSTFGGDLTRTIDFGSTPQPVSQEFYDWFTANANPVEYTLSGKWRFKDTLQPQTADKEGIYLSQEITFTADGDYVENELDDGSFEFFLEEVSYNSLTVYYDDYWEYGGPELHIKYDNSTWYTPEGWNNDAIGPDTPNRQQMDFGSTPQPVSQEFYDWFTANANPVEE